MTSRIYQCTKCNYSLITSLLLPAKGTHCKKASEWPSSILSIGGHFAAKMEEFVFAWHVIPIGRSHSFFFFFAPYDTKVLWVQLGSF